MVNHGFLISATCLRLVYPFALQLCVTVDNISKIKPFGKSRGYLPLVGKIAAKSQKRILKPTKKSVNAWLRN